MTTNSNTADDAIFDNDSDVTDVDTGAVGVAAVRTPTAPVPDCACARCGRRSVRRAGARAGGGVALELARRQGATFFELRAAVDDFDLRRARAPPSSTRPAESPPTADRQSLRAHAPHWSQPPPNSGSCRHTGASIPRWPELFAIPLSRGHGCRYDVA